MDHKLISTQSNRLLAYFNRKGQSGFNYQEALKALPESKESAVRQLLSNMTRRGLLMRLREGVYYIIPYEEDAATYMPDWHLMGEYLTQGAAYYIGYYSALHVHNLIIQPSLKEQIVVSKQLRPSSLTIRNVVFQFIYHNPTHFFGAKKHWIDSYHKVQCSDLEKTLVDCLFKPDYAGGIVEVARALYASRQTLKFDRLLDYVQRFGSQAVVKRLGFLLEILNIDTPIVDRLQQLKGASYVVLDTELPKGGKLVSRWRIQQNVDIATIQSAVRT